MKKKHLVNTLEALKTNLSKNTVTPEGQALIDEITKILGELANDPDVEYNEADILAKVTEAAKAAGANAATEVVNAFKPKAENKVSIAKAREIYEEALKNSVGKGKGAFMQNLNSLMAKNGITGLPSVLEVLPEIQTLFEKHSILGKLRKLGKYAVTFGVSTQTDDDTNTRAGGHVVGDTKANQALVLTPKTINLGAIYKMIDVPKITSYQTGNDTSLFSWLAQELIERLDAEITRAIIVGDGRASNHARKVSTFETIGTKTAADAYTQYVEKSNAVPTIEDVRGLIDAMDDSKPIALYLHPTLKTALQKYVAATGGSTSYITDEVLAQQLGVAEIVKYKKLAYAVPGTASTVPAVVAIQYDSYGYAGSEIFTGEFEKWELNTDNMIAEIFAGGAILKPNSTGLITIKKTA